MSTRAEAAIARALSATFPPADAEALARTAVDALRQDAPAVFLLAVAVSAEEARNASNADVRSETRDERAALRDEVADERDHRADERDLAADRRDTAHPRAD